MADQSLLGNLARRNALLPLLLACLAAAIFLPNLSGADLWDDDEPKNAACGREMLERGDWIVPVYNDQLRSHKPVLLYWAMIASYNFLGVNELGARLPSALAGIGIVMLCYRIGIRLFDRSTAFVAGVLLASGLMFAVLARAATPDAVLMICTTSAFYFFVVGISSLRGGQFSPQSGEAAPSLRTHRLPLKPAAAMYTAMGLALLAKGPIGLLLPALVIATYAIFFSEASGIEAYDFGPGRIRRWLAFFRQSLAPSRVWQLAMGVRAIQGAAIAAVVAGPWYVAVSIATEGEWLAGFIGTHNVHRFMHPMEGHSGSIFYYVAAILAGFFPGSCFLPIAVVHATGDSRRRAARAHSQAFLLCWAGCYLAVFSAAATKLPNYVAPCYPALALLTGAWLTASLRNITARRLWLRMGMASCAIAGVGILTALAVVGVQRLDGNWTVAIVGLVPVLGGLASLYFVERLSSRGALTAFVGSCAVFTAMATSWTAPEVSPYQTSPRIGRRLAELKSAEEGHAVHFATLGYTKPNLVFYSGEPVPWLGDEQAAIEYLAGGRNPDAGLARGGLRET